MVYVYSVRDGSRISIDSIIVMRERRQVGCVLAVVVHDVLRRAGKLVEDTYDWYAQDTSGTVWYVARPRRRTQASSRRRTDYRDCITTEDWSPLEPDTMERKTYCRGVGVVRDVTTRGGREVVELVSMRRPQPRS